VGVWAPMPTGAESVSEEGISKSIEGTVLIAVIGAEFTLESSLLSSFWMSRCFLSSRSLRTGKVL